MAAGSRRIARQKGLDQATQEDAMRRLYGVAQDDHSEVQSEEELRQVRENGLHHGSMWSESGTA